MKQVDINEEKGKGKKIAKLKLNRAINLKSVQKLKETIKKHGIVYMPLLIIEGVALFDAGIDIVDWVTNEKITTREDAEKYIVIIDGQHRYFAFMELEKEKKKDEEYKCFANYVEVGKENIASFLKDLNTTGTAWNTDDFMTWQLVQKDNNLYTKIRELRNDGYKYTSACEWMRLKEGEIKKAELINPPSYSKDELTAINTNITYGEKLLTAAKTKFSKSFCQKKTLPSWIIQKIDILLSAGRPKDKAIDYFEEFFKKISEDQAKKIEEQKGKKGGDTKEQLIRQELNNLYTSLMPDIIKNSKNLELDHSNPI